MSYAIYLTNGTLFATIPDGTINQQSSVTLIGQNYTGYGELQDTNFIQLLENFADSVQPSNPLTGQLWFNSTNKVLTVYNGNAFTVINSTVASDTAPSAPNSGDLWFDTTSQTLDVYNGVTWLQVGPPANVTPIVYTVSSLPSANIKGAGSRAFVSDADTKTFGNLAVAGGNHAVPVYSDGTYWYIG